MRDDLNIGDVKVQLRKGKYVSEGWGQKCQMTYHGVSGQMGGGTAAAASHTVDQGKMAEDISILHVVRAGRTFCRRLGLALSGLSLPQHRLRLSVGVSS